MSVLDAWAFWLIVDKNESIQEYPEIIRNDTDRDTRNVLGEI
jgi:hypothetical protein